MPVLLQLTKVVDFFAMAVTLWLAFYLIARGFPSKITLLGAITLLTLSVFFFSAFYNLFYQAPRSAALRAILLTIGLLTWYSLTYRLSSVKTKRRVRWWSRAIYLLGSFSVIVLAATRYAFIGEQGNTIWVAHMGIGLPFILYGLFQFLTCAGILYNLMADARFGRSPPGRLLMTAGVLSMLTAIYGVLSLALPYPMPRLIQDWLIFSAVFLVGLSIARYDTLVERRSTLYDFPIAGITLLGLSFIYAGLALYLGAGPGVVAAIMVLAILSHSVYDIVREYLDLLRARRETAFRKELRQMENPEQGEAAFYRGLQTGLDLLCSKLDAAGGFIAVRGAETYVVTSSTQSLPPGSQLPQADVTCDDIFQPTSALLQDIAWAAPGFEGSTQAAVVGLGYPKAKLRYSQEELDLLAEIADRIGTLITLERLRPNLPGPEPQVSTVTPENATEMAWHTNEIISAIHADLDLELVKMVEEGLRHLSDYSTLGQIRLTKWMAAGGASHVERGKSVQKILLDAIEALRPAGERPKEPLPGVWYSYVVLHDAYVDCIPNREIMSRLYISEGTFNRTRRKALRSLTRLLMEQGKVG